MYVALAVVVLKNKTWLISLKRTWTFFADGVILHFNLVSDGDFHDNDDNVSTLGQVISKDNGVQLPDPMI